MTTTTEIRIPAKRYEDEDDCLTAAAAEYASEHGLQGWDLSPRWDSDQREAIVLTVPASAATPTTEQIEALRAEAGAAGDLAQVAVCSLALAGDEIAIAECARAIRAAQDQQ